MACAFAKPGLLAAGALGYAGPVAYAGPSAYAAPVAYAGQAAYAAPVAYAGPASYAAPAAYAAPAIAAPLSVRTQYHAQDVLGQASYGHTEPFQTHNAIQVSIWLLALEFPLVDDPTTSTNTLHAVSQYTAPHTWRHLVIHGLLTLRCFLYCSCSTVLHVQMLHRGETGHRATLDTFIGPQMRQQRSLAVKQKYIQPGAHPRGDCRAAAPQTPTKPKFKKHRFCRYYIKKFT